MLKSPGHINNWPPFGDSWCICAWTQIFKNGSKVSMMMHSACGPIGDSPRTTTTTTTLCTQLRLRTATVRTRCSTHTHVHEERSSAPLGRILRGPHLHRRHRQSPRDLWLERAEKSYRTRAQRNRFEWRRPWCY